MKTKIIDMYFEEHRRPVDIANELQIPKYTVTRVLQKDNRYLEEKQKRKNINQINHRNRTKEYMKKKQGIKKLKKDADDLILKRLLLQDSIELSERKRLTNMEYRNWNKSAFSYDKNKNRFEFREELGRSYDVPKYIKLD